MFRHVPAAVTTCAAALALVACGQTTSQDQAGSDATATASDDCKNVATSTGPVDLTDSFGRKVTLDKPAERVVSLEWQQTEDLLTLCVNPVGVADTKGYGTWVSAEKLPEGTTDLGTRGEPNIEALLQTDPDLIVVEAYTANDEIINTLAKYDIPVLATKGADATGSIENMENTFELIAEATGREERAEAVLDEFDDALDQAADTLADRKGTEFVYFDAYIDGANVTIRPFGKGALVADIGEKLGLKNAWTGKVDPAYGLGQTDIEGMTKVGDATFFSTGTDDGSGDVPGELAKNSVWTSIPAVAEDRSYAFPAGIWTFGGPKSSMQVIDAYVDLLKG